jgi:hypothetical protein
MGGSSNTTTTTSGGKDKDKGKDAPAAFTEGERVLAYHGPLLYEAKVALPLLHPPLSLPPSVQLHSGLGFAWRRPRCRLFSVSTSLACSIAARVWAVRGI